MSRKNIPQSSEKEQKNNQTKTNLIEIEELKESKNEKAI